MQSSHINGDSNFAPSGREGVDTLREINLSSQIIDVVRILPSP